MTTPVEDGGLAFDGALVGSVFALSGIASLIMPALIGVVSDKWVNAERLMGVLHWVGAISLFCAAFVTDYDLFKIAMLVNMLAYMPLCHCHIPLHIMLSIKPDWTALRTILP